MTAGCNSEPAPSYTAPAKSAEAQTRKHMIAVPLAVPAKSKIVFGGKPVGEVVVSGDGKHHFSDILLPPEVDITKTDGLGAQVASTCGESTLPLVLPEKKDEKAPPNSFVLKDGDSAKSWVYVHRDGATSTVKVGKQVLPGDKSGPPT